MLCALIDTSGRSILLGTADREGRVLSAVEVEHSKEHAAKLPELLSSALCEAGREAGELEYICVGCGPGSFIGTRNGVSFSNGFASASGIRVLGIGSMESAAAEHALNAASVMVVREARRNSMFAGVYRKGDSGLRILGEREVAMDEMGGLIVGAIELAREGSLVIVTDSAEMRNAIGLENELRATLVFKPNVADIRGMALLAAARRSQAGDSADVRYLRLPV